MMPTVFFWMEKAKAIRQLPDFLKFGSCDVCKDTLTAEGEFIIKRDQGGVDVTARYCKHCKILLND